MVAWGDFISGVVVVLAAFFRENAGSELVSDDDGCTEETRQDELCTITGKFDDDNFECLLKIEVCKGRKYAKDGNICQRKYVSDTAYKCSKGNWRPTGSRLQAKHRAKRFFWGGHHENEPPHFRYCPENIEVHASSGRTSANVGWREPDPTDPDDVEAPKFPNGCPADQNLYSGPLESPVPVTWTDPATSDNSGRHVTLTSRPVKGSTLEPGHHTVTISARDSAGNKAECSFIVSVQVRHCQPLMSAAHGLLNCTRNDVEGSDCTVNCDEGYEPRGQNPVTCNGTEWTAGVPSCETVQCPALPNTTHGSVECFDEDHRYESTCTLSCEQGFTVQGAAQTKCKADKTWTTLGSCVDAEAPVFVNGCPDDVQETAAPLGKDTLVHWSPPVVADNSRNPAHVDSDLEPGAAFPVGITQVTYTATDDSGNNASCTFSVNITALQCDSPEHENVEEHNGTGTEYSCPDGYVNGAVCNVSCLSGYVLIGRKNIRCERVNGAFPPTAEWEPSGPEKPVCREDKCPALRPPDHGALSCFFGELGWDCMMFCDAMWDVPLQTDGHFYCTSEFGTWSPPTVPNCNRRVLPTRTRHLSSLFYFTGSCELSADDLRANFIKLIDNSNYKDACVLVPSCTANNVKVFCESMAERTKREIKGESDNANDLLSSLKRDRQFSNVPNTHYIRVTFDVEVPYEEDSFSAEDMYRKHTAVGDKLWTVMKAAAQAGHFNMHGLTVEESSIGWPTIVADCPPGTLLVTRNITRFSCVGCGVGHYLPEGSTQCEACPVGSYTQLDSATSCTPCPPGRSTPTTGTPNSSGCKGCVVFELAVSQQLSELLSPRKDCTEAQCPQLRYVPHATQTCDNWGGIYGTQCSQTCDSGYSLVGVSHDTECQRNGQWNPPLPTCEAISCGYPGSVPGGTVECPGGFEYPQVCVIRCKQGYQNSGASFMKCESNGQWSRDASHCIDVEPPLFSGGCPSNMELESGPLESPVNVTWIPPSVTDNSGGKVTVVSQPPQGSPFGPGLHAVRITATDENNNVGVCGFFVTVRAIQCPTPPQVDHGSIQCMFGLQYQAMCLLTCESGFKATGPTSIYCLETGQWSTPGTCHDTLPPVFDNGCPANIEAFASRLGSPTTVTWNPPSVSDNDMSNPVQLDSDIAPGSEFSVGVTYVSYTATDPSGNTNRCQFSVTVTSRTCGFPDLEEPGRQRTLMVYECPDGYVHGASCTMNCSYGYPLLRGKPITCELDTSTPPSTMKWKWPGWPADKPECKATNCTKLAPPANGALSCMVADFVRQTPRRVRLMSDIFYYTGNCSVNLDRLKADFITRLSNSTWRDACVQVPSCTAENVQVICGSITRKRRDASFWRQLTAMKSRRRRQSNSHYVDITFEIVIDYVEGAKTADQFYQDTMATKEQIVQHLADEAKAGLFNVGGLVADETSVGYPTVSVDCPPGNTYIEKAENTHFSCSGCGQGFYVSEGSTQCEACPVGSYTELDNATSCTPCPPGWSTVSTGSQNSSDCKELCAEGSASPTGFVPCQPCSPGHYQLLQGAKTCDLCPAGTWTANEGATSSDLCVPADALLFNESLSASVVGQWSELTLTVWLLVRGNASAGITFTVGPDSAESFSLHVLSANDSESSETPQNREVTGVVEPDTWTRLLVIIDQNADTRIYIGDTQVKYVNRPAVTHNDDASFTFDSSSGEAIDECLQSPCGLHPCENQPNGFVCHCQDGWSGDTCSTPPDPCYNNDCRNGATCVSGADNYTCLCPSEFAGRLCDAMIVDGNWTSWSDWTICSATCGGGEKSRTRSCTNPAPQHGGSDCIGAGMEKKACNTEVCPECSAVRRSVGTVLVCNETDSPPLKTCNLRCLPGYAAQHEFPLYKCGQETGYLWNYQRSPQQFVELPSCSQSIDLNGSCDNRMAASVKTAVGDNMQVLPCVRNGVCSTEVTTDCGARRGKRSTTGNRVHVIFHMTTDFGPSEMLQENDTDSMQKYFQLLTIAGESARMVALNDTERLFTVHVDGAVITPDMTTASYNASLECPDGNVENRGVCVECPTGTMLDGDECKPCPLGQYQDQTGSAHCKMCPAGHTWDFEGAFSASQCLSVTCPAHVGDDPHGSFVCTEGHSFSSSCSLACNTGYKVNGSASVTCKKDGTWTTSGSCQ
ncbi:hypothetical protein BaRGS_00037420, partial [Batillaria attramentaria]